MRQPGPTRGRRGLAREPMVLTSAAIAAVGMGWFLVNLRAPVGPAVLGWLPALASLALTVAALRKVAASPGLPPATRRFWRTLTVAGVLASGTPGVSLATALVGSFPYRQAVV